MCGITGWVSFTCDPRRTGDGRRDGRNHVPPGPGRPRHLADRARRAQPPSVGDHRSVCPHVGLLVARMGRGIAVVVRPTALLHVKDESRFRADTADEYGSFGAWLEGSGVLVTWPDSRGMWQTPVRHDQRVGASHMDLGRARMRS